MGGVKLNRTGSASDPGKVRSENQDAFAVRELHDGVLMVVADGMGGHQGGRDASRMVVDTVVQEVDLADVQWNEPHQVRSLLERSLLRANTEVFRTAGRDSQVHNMGSTALAVLVVGRDVYVAHAGDSRLYLVRGGRALRLTRDHSAAQAMVDAGKISPAQARSHPDAHLLMRAVGVREELAPEVRAGRLRLEHMDALLLCTDGLYEKVDGREIARAMTKFPPQEACDRLVELASRRGATDNVTVVGYCRGEPDSAADRAVTELTREVAGVPVWLWGVAGAISLVAALLFVLAVTS